MVVVGADISATRSRPRVMVIQELLPAGDPAGGLWYSLVVVMMVVVIHHDLGVRLSACALILCHVVEVASFTIAAAIVGVSALNHVHEVNVGTARAQAHPSVVTACIGATGGG